MSMPITWCPICKSVQEMHKPDCPNNPNPSHPMNKCELPARQQGKTAIQFDQVLAHLEEGKTVWLTLPDEM